MSSVVKGLIFATTALITLFAATSLYTDIHALGEKLAIFEWGAFALALGLALLNYAFRFIRWSFYLRRRKLSIPPLLSVCVFVSAFAMVLTPGKLGELIKSLLLRTTCKIPVALTAPLVIAERITDLTALLLVGAVGVLVYGVAQTLVLTSMVCIFTGLALIAWPPLARALISIVTQAQPTRRFRQRLHKLYYNLFDLVQPGPLFSATSLGVVAWLSEGLGFAAILAAFPGTDVPVGLAVLIYAATTLAGALSFLPGGLIVTEGAMILLLVESSAGVDTETAFAATLLTRLATLWFAVILGVLALTTLKRFTPLAADPRQEKPDILGA